MTDSKEHNARASLRPRERIFLILSLDLIRERTDVRHSRVYDVTDEQIIVAQTEPPISLALVGAEIEAAFFEPGQTVGRPFGFSTTLRACIPDYPLAGGQETVEALVIAPPTEAPAPISLRLHCRLTANDELGVSVKIKGAAKSVLLDISAGGMLVFFPGATPYAVGERLGYRLIFRQGGVIRGQADVRDAFEMRDTDAPLRQAGAVARLKFLSRDIADTRLLDRTLHRAMFLLVDS